MMTMLQPRWLLSASLLSQLSFSRLLKRTLTRIRFITALLEPRRVDWDKLKALCDESKANGNPTAIVPTI